VAGTPYGGTPAHKQVAAELRRRILSGEYEPGSRIPSRSQIRAEFGVGATAALEAMRVLLAEGLVEGRSGSGTFVRSPTPVRLVRHWQATSPERMPWIVAIEGQPDMPAKWESESATWEAPADVAARLGIAAGDRVMRSEYLFRADGVPVMLVVSWEPYEITGGTPILLPERGPLAGQGVPVRMASIGLQVTRTEEDITARAALPDEAERLAVPRQSVLVLVERTYRTADRAVETATILVPAAGRRLRYELPVSPGK
jgi:DNA-binding GntR family transcriptional regulator